MTDVDKIWLTLKVDKGSEPISGTISANGSEREFAGWMGLAQVLEELIASAS